MTRKLNLKLVLSLLGGLLIVAVGVHFLHTHQLSENAYRLLERAERALQVKDLDKAELYYQQYLSFVPNDADTVQKLAHILDARVETVGQRIQLVLLMEQVLRLKPNEQELRIRLVHHLLALDRVTEAIDNLRRLERTWRDRAEILHMLGWCLEAKKDYPQAVKALEEAIRVNPKQLKTYPILVEVLQDRLSQPDDALKVIDDMVRANADSYHAYLTRARFHQRRGDAKAEEDLAQAYTLAPGRAEVIYAVAEAARARGNWTEAERLLKDGMKRFPNQADFYRLMVNVHLANKNESQALKVLQDGVKFAPQANELAVLLIDMMIDKQQYAEAKTKIDELRDSGLRPTLPNYLTARLHIADKKWNEATQLLESVRADLGPGSEWSSRVQVLLGLCYRHTGDHEQELHAFRRAALEDPAWTTANLGLGEAYLNNGRLEEASQALEPLRSAKDLPAGYWLLLSRTRIHVQMSQPESERRWTTVEEALARAAKDETGAANPIVRAQLQAARKDYTGARTTLEKARAEHPAEVAVWCALADLAVRQNQLDDAENILAQAAAENACRDQLDVRLAQIRLWGQRGNTSDQVKLARLGNERHSSMPAEQRTRLARELAETWHHLGAWDHAEAIWRELARALPKDLRSRFALLELALQKNQTAAAREWRDALKIIEGEQGRLWRYGAAAVLVQEAQGRRSQLDEARQQLHELEKVHKNWSRIPLLAGSIAELEGRYHQAILDYTRAIDLGETQPRVLTRLLELLVERREFGKAEAELSRYEQKAPLTRDLARLGAEVALGMRNTQHAKLAVKRAEQAVSLPPRDHRDALWLARVYQAAGENAEAEALLRDTLAEAGHAPDAWIAWLEHLAHTNQRDAGLRDLERMKKEVPVNRQALTVARAYEAMRLPEQADVAYQAALRDQPRDFILLAYAADFYRRADRHDEARKWYERLLDPALGAPAESIVKARRHLAVLLASSTRVQALALLAENKKARGDTIADERVRLFIESHTASARATAISKFQDSLRLQLPTPDERVLLAQMLDAAGYAGQAQLQLAEAVDQAPTAPEYLARYVRLLIRMEELEDARRQVARLETLEPSSARVRELRNALSRDK